MNIIKKLKSNDGVCIKYLQKTKDDFIVETAFVDYVNKYIICFSSQLGCPIGCAMCYNGISKKFYRNLSKEEIIEQCINVIEDNELKENKPILFGCMGVGEPFLNYINVINSIKNLDKKYPNSKFAIATTGIDLSKFSCLLEDLKDIKNFKLTISLHGSNQKVRNKLIPTKTSLKELVKEVKKYEELSKNKVEWNYILLENINDSIKDALELCDLLDSGSYIKINHYNKIEGIDFEQSKNIKDFMNILEEKGLICEYYETNGEDINAACGQMASYEYEKINK